MKKKEALEFTAVLMRKSEAVFLATVDSQGKPQVRAMVNLRNPANYPKLQSFFDKYPQRLHTFFSTLSTSEKVKQINSCPQVAIYYSIPSRFYGVMLSGIMETVKDKSIKKTLWHDEWEIYFSKKWQDPKYRIFRFIPEYIKGWTETRKFSFKL